MIRLKKPGRIIFWFKNMIWRCESAWTQADRPSSSCSISVFLLFIDSYRSLIYLLPLSLSLFFAFVYLDATSAWEATPLIQFACAWVNAVVV
jgi:hypothetical protein